MKNGYKHFFLRIVGIIGIAILSIIAFNFLNDEFCVFQKISQNKINKKKFWPNERLLKNKIYSEKSRQIRLVYYGLIKSQQNERFRP